MTRTVLKKILLSTLVLPAAGAVIVVLPSTTTAGGVPCALDRCPRELTAADDRGVFTYRVNQRFNVLLDRRAFQPGTFTCGPGEVVSAVASVPDLYPNHMTRFEAVAAGACQLQNGGFSVTITAVE